MATPLDPQGTPLTEGPLSRGYLHLPSIMPTWWSRKLPPLTYWYIEQMLTDPQVRLSLMTRKAPLRKATIVIRAANPNVREYVVQTFQRIWRNGLRKILRGFEYGYSAAEILWRIENRTICYTGLKDFHAADARPLTWEGKLAGIRLRNTQSSYTNIFSGSTSNEDGANPNHRPRLPVRAGGSIDLLGARALWYTHDAAYGNWFGQSVLYSAQRPFDEKCSNDAAQDSRRTWYHKYAFQGPIIGYPVRDYAYKTGEGAETVQLIAARDLARQIGEEARNGGVITKPNTVNPTTNQPDWTFDWPQAAAPNHDLRGYIEDLDKEITRGIGVPDEVLQSDGTGALAGRRVPERSFYATCEDDLFELIETIKQQVLEPGVAMNFGNSGDTTFEVISAQLEPTEQSPDDTQGGEPGQQQQPGQPPGRPQPGPVAGMVATAKKPVAPGQVALSLRRGEACLLYGATVVLPRRRTRTSLAMVRSIGTPRTAPPGDVAEQIAEVAVAFGAKLKKRTLHRLREAIAKHQFTTPEILGRKLRKILNEANAKYAAAISQAIVASYLHGAAKASETVPLVAGHDGAKAAESVLVPTSSQDVPSTPPLPPSFFPFGVIAPPPPPPADRTGTIEESWPDDVGLRFPSLETAVDKIRSKIPMDREDFAALGDAARTEAFSVAGEHTAQAIVHMQEALADTLAHGASMEDFRRELIGRLGDNPLAPWHAETVFRTNIMSAFHAGEQDVFRHPLITGEFPYIAYDAIPDTRVRDNHLAMMHYGIPYENGQNSNIYRADDPIWDIWYPPNGYACRCAVRYLTVRQAARLGIPEAIEWERTGKAPTNPYRATLPPGLLPDPGFASRPSVGSPNLTRLSYRLSERWITINGDTGHGQHIAIDDSGTVTKGPSALTGRPLPAKKPRRESARPRKLVGKAPAPTTSNVHQFDGEEFTMQHPKNAQPFKGRNSTKEAQKAFAFAKMGAGVMKASDLDVDPVRFQYKLNTANPMGVTDQFADVKKFNPDFAGTLHVWTDPEDGKTWVVNGHHRFDLARRSGYNGELQVYHIDQPDAARARAFGALVNIAAGDGTSVDAAKFMRDTGSTMADFKEHGISLKGKVAADAAVLAKLSPRLFNKLAEGNYRENRALAIARHVESHDDQDFLDKKIDEWEEKNGRDVNDSTVEQMAKKMRLAAKTTNTVKNLFGEEEEEQNLFVEKADIEAGIRRELTQRLNAFKAVSTDKKAGTLADKGNVIKAEDNRTEAKRMENILDDFDRESYYSGPITDALNQAAKQLAATPRKRNEILKASLETILPLLQTVSKTDGGGADGNVRAGEKGDGRGEGSSGGDEGGEPPHKPARGQTGFGFDE